jgi:RND family efflux transporter MFP subunit
MAPQHSRAWSRVWSVCSGLLALAGLVLVLAWMSGAFRPKVAPGVVPDERPMAASRRLVPVERVRGEETVTAVASVQPRRKADVASQVLATVQEVKVNPGDRVKAGDLLVVLDDRELVAQQREAQAAAGAAEADLVLRKRDYDRLKELYPKGAASREDLDRVEGAYSVAQAQLRRSQEQVARIEVQLGYTKIRAASEAVVADRFADPGDLAVPGKPLLALQNVSEPELHANVPESLALRVTVGQPLAFRIEAAGVSARGPVREVVPLAQQATRSVLIKVSIPPDVSTPVFAGMFGRVVLPVGRTERLLIPAAAVQRVGQLELVEVAGPDGRLERRFVRLGREAGERVEVLSGLNDGERVALPAR